MRCTVPCDAEAAFEGVGQNANTRGAWSLRRSLERKYVGRLVVAEVTRDGMVIGLLPNEGSFDLAVKIVAPTRRFSELKFGRSPRIVLEKIGGKPLKGVVGLLKTRVGKRFCENWEHESFQILLNFSGGHDRGRGRDVWEKCGNFARG